MTRNSHTLTAHESPISKVFNDDYLFEIPKYQRPYSWTTDQATELISDLLDYTKDNNENISPYFLGSIVLIKANDSVSQVVDGQQRLTTLTILFSVLRELIKNDKMKSSLTKRIVQEGDYGAGIKDSYRIRLRKNDADFFEKYIQKANKLEGLFLSEEKLNYSQSNIKNNAKAIHLVLKKYPENDLEKLAKFIINHCYLVVVVTADFDSAYRIFSVMNDRGLDLTATDILKSEIIGSIIEKEKDKEDEYTKKWEDQEESIGRENFNVLFSHIRMIYRKSKQKGTLVKEFREYVKPTDNARDFIDGKLIPYTQAYSAILNNSYDYTGEEIDKEINTIFEWLKQVDNSDWLPPAIDFLAKYGKDPQLLLSFLRKLERRASCMAIFRANVNNRIDNYKELLTWIKEGKDVLSPESPIHLKNEEISKTIEALNGNIYENSRVRKMILLRLDSLLSDSSATYNHKIITIEHILPQNPNVSSQWVEWIPDEETRNSLVHKLGNLVLLSRSKNSSASNYEFDKKKEAYFSKNGTSPFALTTGVLEQPEWNEGVILRRQKNYVAKLKEEWGLHIT